MIPPPGPSATPVEVASLRQADDLARRAARIVFDRPVLLEAGAGTGKTNALVARLVWWCLGPGWEMSRVAMEGRPSSTEVWSTEVRPTDDERVAARVIERVAAITFTERAAGEMSDRFARTLDEVRREDEVTGLPLAELGLSLAQRSHRAMALLAVFDRFSVGTIHAFCRRILAAHPLEAGLHPFFHIDAEGEALEALVESVLVARLPQLYGEGGEEDALVLAAAGHAPAELARATIELARHGVPVAALVADPFPRALVDRKRDELLAKVGGLLVHLRPALADAPAAHRIRKVRECLAALERLVQELAAVQNVDELIAAVRRVDRSVEDRLGSWAHREFTSSEESAFGAEREETVARRAKIVRHALKHLRQLDPALLLRLLRLLRPLLEEVNRRLRASGVETFDALLSDARDLMVNVPSVADHLRRSLDQLLVDEFQDTDPVQCDIVRLLALTGAADQRPGLFVVGDPKQSIYGWRSADLEAYESFVRELLAAGGVKHSLVVNFRSVPAILEEVERIMAPVMKAEPGIQPSFQPLVPSAPAPGGAGARLPGDRCAVEYWIPRCSDPAARGARELSAARAREVEAQALACDLVDLHRHHGLPWSGSAILLRAASSLEIYLKALREAGVPFVVERDRSYYRRREVIDGVALIRALLDPTDDLALLTTLRSPLCGVPDAALLPLWRRKFVEEVRCCSAAEGEDLARLDRLVEEVRQALPPTLPGLARVEGWDLCLRVFLRQLTALRRAFHRLPVDRWMEELRATFLTEETEAARFLGPHRLANLERFFRQVERSLDEEGTPQALLRRLRAGISGRREEEEGVLADQAVDAVRVLTIHKAKGLDFDQVYVVDLSRQPRARALARRSVKVERWGSGWALDLGGAQTLDFEEVEEWRERVAAAETIRTLYVATTRPRRRLVMVGSWPKGIDGRKPVALARSHMDLLQHRQGDRPTLDGEPRVEGEDVRWIFLEEGRATNPRSTAEALPPPITLDEARHEADRLNDHRRAAKALLAQPLIQTVSVAAHEARRLRPGDTEHGVGKEEPPGERVADGKERALVPRAVGIAIHRVLESLELTGDPAEEMKQQRRRLRRYLEHDLSGSDLTLALEEVEKLVDALGASALLQRLWRLAPHLLGREVPILLQRGVEHGLSGVTVGTVDLLYRDPETGRMVIADYKTDRLRRGETLAERARAHAAQGGLYLEAVHRALGGPSPRFELWFLRLDRVVEVTPP